MPNPQQPDTSPANVAHMLREAAAAICVLGTHMKQHGAEESEAYPFRNQVAELRLTADYLELERSSYRTADQFEAHEMENARNDAIERVYEIVREARRTAISDNEDTAYGEDTMRAAILSDLRAAFPRYAPTESESDD